MTALGSSAWAARLGRAARIGCAVLAGAAGTATLATIILWDADFAAARERWERFKAAFFGPWPAECCALPAALQDARDITFFTQSPVAGRTFVVTTGVTFAGPGDLQANRVARRWCYVLIAPDGQLERRVELANQTGDAPPEYEQISYTRRDEVAALGIEVTQLEALARSHCRFSFGKEH